MKIILHIIKMIFESIKMSYFFWVWGHTPLDVGDARHKIVYYSSIRASVAELFLALGACSEQEQPWVLFLIKKIL